MCPASLALFCLQLGVTSQAASKPKNYDVVVYDATSGGVIAAVAAARHGARTALLCASWPACFPEGGLRVGGMSSGGLGQTDTGRGAGLIGGFAREFYRRNRAHYSKPGDPPIQNGTTCRVPTPGCDVLVNLEPHVAKATFEAMLKEAGVDIFFTAQVESVTHTAGSGPKTISSIKLVDGRCFEASVWIDAGYEGDLLARAGASFVTGREAIAEYNETLAGRRLGDRSNEMDLPINPFVNNGTSGPTLPFVDAEPSPAAFGEADDRVQSYNFRLCVTKNSTIRAPFPKVRK